MTEAFASQPIPCAERVRWSADAMDEAAAICGRLGLDLHAVIGADAVPPGGLGSDALHRIGTLVGIDRALVVIFGSDQGVAWFHRPNAGLAFAGRSPAQVIQQDGLPGLLRVRAILDGMKVGIFSPPAHDPDLPPLKFRIAPA